MSGRAAARVVMPLAVLGAALGLAACGGDDDDDGGGGGGTISYLLPESKTARYETQDRPLFEAKVEAECPDCEILYSNADQDTSKQQQQVEAAITEGVDVMVLDPVDSAAAAGLVSRAKQADIPVISYDRLILDADLDYYVSFDSVEVGRQQGEALSKKLAEEKSPEGPIVQINGAPTDNNAKLFNQGSTEIFDQEGVQIAKEYDTPDWSPDEAQLEMEQAITAEGENGFAGVYAANDGTAGGAIAAMKSAGINPADKPTTGQDAELAAIQRILAGEQYMTVYKPIKPLAESAAELAVAIAQGEDPPEGLVNGEEDNGQEQVPTVFLETIPVFQDNIEDTIIKDDFWSVDEICTKAYAQDCKEAGLQ
jgi:D-xylose transport system substrate-binding protein